MSKKNRSQTNNVQNNFEDPNDEKLNITKSVFQTAREMQEKKAAEELAKQEELERKIAEREKKKREEHDRQLEEDRKELIRLKQGLISESDTIHEEQPQEIHLSFWQKISSFFYLNKWWLGIGLLCAAVFSYLIYDLVTKPRPDMTVLIIGESSALDEESSLADYFARFADDYNSNGEILVSAYYIPYTDNPQRNYANGVDTKLTAELQSADSVIVIGNKYVDDILKADEVFVDLSDIYPENPHVKKYKYLLKDTGFAEKIGLSPDRLSDDWFIAVRRPAKLMYSSEEDMQEIYDRDFVVFDSIINDLS